MKNLTKETEQILDKLGINISHNGYKYWILAVQMKIKKPYIQMEDLYVELAKECGVTKSSIERCLRHAYATANKNLRVQKYFNLQYKVTNSVFLECLIREIQYGQ